MIVDFEVHFPTYNPKVCKIMASRAIIKVLGLLCYILLRFR